LNEKHISAEVIDLLEGCLREKEIVEKNVDGKMITDPDRSRFGLEDIYLHPVFGRELNYIPQEIGGSNILLTAKILA
jgi:hypothetical protein